MPVVINDCGRCKLKIPVGHEESCWYCLGPLCGDCWDVIGHCGEPEAVEFNEKAKKWKSGDPLLPSPWGIGAGRQDQTERESSE